MSLKTFKPYTKSTRGTILVDRSGLWKGKPFKALVEPKNSMKGRNNNGHITSRNRAGGHKFHESDFRRNLVTEGIRLNDLVGKRFNINGVIFYGVQLCEPCASLQRRLGVRILPDMIGKGGLRAQIRGIGVISVGDSICQMG
jgi:hypothetical protein